jgi:hypothetical protein
LRDIEPRLRRGGKYELANLQLQGDTIAASAIRKPRKSRRVNKRLGDPTTAKPSAPAISVREAHGLRADLQAANDEVAARHVLVMRDEERVDERAPAAPITGTSCATVSGDDHPNRAAMRLTSRTSAGRLLREALLRRCSTPR